MPRTSGTPIISFLTENSFSDPTVPARIADAMNVRKVDRQGFEAFIARGMDAGSERQWRPLKPEELIRRLVRASRLPDAEKVRIVLCPTKSSFIKEEMEGVAGFTPSKDAIVLLLSAERGHKAALARTVYHELAHAVALRKLRRATLLDDLVFEGVAERFAEAMTGRKSRLVRISECQAKMLFRELESMLRKRDEQLYKDLFFGSTKYPVWAGYAIGYYLVGEYLRMTEETKWPKLLQTQPRHILATLTRFRKETDAGK